MSTSIITVGLRHNDSNLGVSATYQSVSEFDSFTNKVLTILSSDGDVALDIDDVGIPRYAMIQLLDGSPLKVGFDGTTYPMRLQFPGEPICLRLDIESYIKEKTTVVTQPDVSGSLGETGFDLSDTVGPVRFWGNNTTATFASGVITYGTPATNDTYIVNGIAYQETTDFTSIGTLKDAINLDTDVVAAVVGATITVTSAVVGSAGNTIGLSLNPGNTGTGQAVSGPTLTGGADVSVAPPVPDGGRLVAFPLAVNATANTIAASLRALVDAAFVITGATNTAIFTAATVGYRTPVANNNTTFTISRTLDVTGGLNVHYRSEGTSKIIIGLTPA